MSGYGAPVVFGGVWGISSAVCWGVAAWRRWRQGSDHADSAGHGKKHTDGEGTETAKSHPRLLEE
jgi:hypothetical protein